MEKRIAIYILYMIAPVMLKSSGFVGVLTRIEPFQLLQNSKLSPGSFARRLALVRRQEPLTGRAVRIRHRVRQQGDVQVFGVLQEPRAQQIAPFVVTILEVVTADTIVLLYKVLGITADADDPLAGEGSVAREGVVAEEEAARSGGGYALAATVGTRDYDTAAPSHSLVETRGGLAQEGE